mmetsp:Transcript_117822/g.337858  ORF Transcript_117822/g.337858 Transcript_117822/m.337858 type:complete len:338 (-) Transcript_117822:408-1421(-)
MGPPCAIFSICSNMARNLSFGATVTSAPAGGATPNGSGSGGAGPIPVSARRPARAEWSSAPWALAARLSMARMSLPCFLRSRSRDFSCCDSLSWPSVSSWKLAVFFLCLSWDRRLITSSSSSRNSEWSLLAFTCARNSPMDRCMESSNAPALVSMVRTSWCICEAEDSSLSSCACILETVGIISLSSRCWMERRPSRACWRGWFMACREPSALVKRSLMPLDSSFSFATPLAVSLIAARCCSASARRLLSASSRKASSALVCRASVCATRTSNLSRRAWTSWTSLLSAFTESACSMATLSAFLLNSLFKASRWPMKTDSAIVSMYARKSVTLFIKLL